MNFIIYDIEVYPNRIGVALKMDGKKYWIDSIERIKKLPLNDNKYQWVGFNNRRYDHPVLLHTVIGGNPYKKSVDLIVNKNEDMCWNTNIIDLLEICPKIAKCSLKEMGHRLGYKVLQNLPFPYDKPLNDEEWEVVKNYSLEHDLNITEMFWEELKEEYEARQSLKKYFDIKTEYGGAPRLAEKAILSKLGDNKISSRNDRELKKQKNIKLSDEMKILYDEAFNYKFEEYVQGKPDFMSKKHNVQGCMVDFGIGGLHGISKVGMYKDVYDYDVSSYYPSIILNCHLGSEKFRRIYKTLYDKRIYLKNNKLPGANSLKLVLNSLYGKLADKYSSPQIYAPHIALTICLLGQFYLIDLMCKLDLNQCLLANTDGIICSSPISNDIISEWENRTGFKLNCTKYKKLILKDVNSYYALLENGKEKRKKEFNLPKWTHNIRSPIIAKAVISLLIDNKPISETILNCTNLYDFCFFTKVKGGDDKILLLDGEPIADPKIRYYIATKGHILERQSCKVTSRLCKDSPVKLAMNLTNITKESNINYNWYIKQAENLVNKIIGHDRDTGTNGFC